MPSSIAFLSHSNAQTCPEHVVLAHHDHVYLTTFPFPCYCTIHCSWCTQRYLEPQAFVVPVALFHHPHLCASKPDPPRSFLTETLTTVSSSPAPRCTQLLHLPNRRKGVKIPRAKLNNCTTWACMGRTGRAISACRIPVSRPKTKTKVRVCSEIASAWGPLSEFRETKTT